MCGIAAVIRRQKPIGETDSRAMASLLNGIAYRGPDGFGQWSQDRILLGHRRLSIIDLSANASQPMHEECRGLHVVFNGEIYNYRELRDELETLGWIFRTRSDTEVILAAYAHFGMDWIRRLRGMFAFVLYDEGTHVVTLARDRMGKKPLFYYFDGNSLIVCSEIKGFHAFPDISLDIDQESLRAFFSLQFIPAPHTIYRSIRKLLPGSALRLAIEPWTNVTRQYWSLEESFKQPVGPAVELDELQDKLERSVAYRMIADVEVGILLSGGIDSSLISIAARRSTNRKLRAFSVSFGDEAMDETRYAKAVAAAVGLEFVPVSGESLSPTTFMDVLFHADEPLGDPAAVPTYQVAHELSRYVKVVLSGEGADELFGGYPYYQTEMRWQQLTRGSIPSVSAAFHPILRAIENSPRLPPIASRAAKLASSTHEEGVTRWVTVFGEPSILSILPHVQGEPRHRAQLVDLFNRFRLHRSELESSFSLDIAFWLPDDLLVKVDRMTMAHSVEARAPFLDADLVDLAIRMPLAQKVSTKQTKMVLRSLLEQGLRDYRLAGLVERKKHGFETPTARWLSGELKELCEGLIGSGGNAFPDLLNRKRVFQLWRGFMRFGGTHSYVRKIWVLICFLGWYNHHANRFGLSVPPRSAEAAH
jgi:asparagine synthase (glutamine-hydrolysing)